MPHFSIAERASRIIGLFPLAPKIFGSYKVKVEYRPEGRFQNRWN